MRHPSESSTATIHHSTERTTPTPSFSQDNMQSLVVIYVGLPKEPETGDPQSWIQVFLTKGNRLADVLTEDSARHFQMLKKSSSLLSIFNQVWPSLAHLNHKQPLLWTKACIYNTTTLESKPVVNWTSLHGSQRSQEMNPMSSFLISCSQNAPPEHILAYN